MWSARGLHSRGQWLDARTVGMADAAPNIEMRMAAGAVTRAVMVFSPVDSIQRRCVRVCWELCNESYRKSE